QAGSPQVVSDQAGDADLVWRGSDQRLWTIGYRDGRWAPQATAISAPVVASDPTVVSWAPGRIDAFFTGRDGRVWQATYHAGFFGTGSWATPVQLGDGNLNGAPHAVVTGAGSLELFWKSSAGDIWHDRYSAGWSGAAPIGTGPIAGDPVPVATGQGMAD